LEEDCIYFTSDMYYFSYCGQVSILPIHITVLVLNIYVSSKDEKFKFHCIRTDVPQKDVALENEGRSGR